MAFNLTYHHYSENAILICWPQKIDTNILKDVLRFKFSIEISGIKQLVQVNNAYNSILVIYVDTIDNINSEISTLQRLYTMKIDSPKTHSKLWNIPVCYDEKFGVDLQYISETLSLSTAHLIHLHSKIKYTVYFIGFLPGFMYLGGLQKELHYPRKSQPRTKVKKGAVAIGGEQTGIYPMDSPGGWHIIGNSPINFFDSNQVSPCIINAGDQIKFQQVTIEEHEHIGNAVMNNTYKLKYELIDG